LVSAGWIAEVRTYRIISEYVTMLHPDEVFVSIFDASMPGNAEEVLRFPGRTFNASYSARTLVTKCRTTLPTVDLLEAAFETMAAMTASSRAFRSPTKDVPCFIR
jgi:hypothetical protein